MKKILLVLPIMVICTSCLKSPKELHIENSPTINETIINIETNLPTNTETLPPSLEPTNTTSPSPKTENTSKPTLTPSTKPSTEPTPKIETINSSSPTITPEESITPSTSPEKQYETGIEIDNIALDFLGKTLDGKDIKLSDYRGKTVFLNFWATWCGPCVRELPYIQKIHETYSDVVILTVNCGDNSTDIKNFMTKNNYTFNVIPDENGVISYLYYTDYIPLTLIIDENGIIKERHIGSLTENEMLNLLNKGEE